MSYLYRHPLIVLLTIIIRLFTYLHCRLTNDIFAINVPDVIIIVMYFVIELDGEFEFL